MASAILVDGEFFLKRYRLLKGKADPAKVAADLCGMCKYHLTTKSGREKKLYRIFYYDCPPLLKKVHNPIDSKAIDFSKTSTATWRLEFLDELKKKRKIALRLGYLNENSGYWIIKLDKLKEIFNGKIQFSDLKKDDVKYEVRQKGVDMRIGLDIASMAFKKQVDQIILVAGDSDFVPAAKLARREGIDFILDPMWASIRADLHEHIDGLRSIFGKEKEMNQTIGAVYAPDKKSI